MYLTKISLPMNTVRAAWATLATEHEPAVADLNSLYYTFTDYSSLHECADDILRWMLEQFREDALYVEVHGLWSSYRLTALNLAVEDIKTFAPDKAATKNPVELWLELFKEEGR